MYRRNSTTKGCPSCGTGNRASRDTCWKCNEELSPSAEKPLFHARNLRGPSLRSNPDEETDEDDDESDDSAGTWANGSSAYRRNPHPIFRRNPAWLDENSTWLGDDMSGRSFDADSDDDEDDNQYEENPVNECVSCGDDTENKTHCDDCDPVTQEPASETPMAGSNYYRRNPVRNSYLNRRNPGIPAWMSSGRPTFGRGMRRRNPSGMMQSLYPETGDSYDGVWGKPSFRRNPSGMMQSLYPETGDSYDGVWGKPSFSRRNPSGMMQSLYPETGDSYDGVWGKPSFRRN